MLPGYRYKLYRNEELIVELDGLSSQHIDFPPLIGENGEAELNYNIVLESDSGELICDAQVSSELFLGLFL